MFNLQDLSLSVSFKDEIKHNIYTFRPKKMITSDPNITRIRNVYYQPIESKNISAIPAILKIACAYLQEK